MNIFIRIALMFVCCAAIFFALELHALRGGFLDNAVTATFIYVGVDWLHKLGRGWNP